MCSFKRANQTAKWECEKESKSSKSIRRTKEQAKRMLSERPKWLNDRLEIDVCVQAWVSEWTRDFRAKEKTERAMRPLLFLMGFFHATALWNFNSSHLFIFSFRPCKNQAVNNKTIFSSYVRFYTHQLQMTIVRFFYTFIGQLCTYCIFFSLSSQENG